MAETLEAVILSGPRRGEIVTLPASSAFQPLAENLDSLNGALDDLNLALERVSARTTRCPSIAPTEDLGGLMPVEQVQGRSGTCGVTFLETAPQAALASGSRSSDFGLLTAPLFATALCVTLDGSCQMLPIAFPAVSLPER